MRKYGRSCGERQQCGSIREGTRCLHTRLSLARTHSSYPGSAPKSAAVLPNSDIVLYQNYPNPFNPNTAISFSVPVPMHVRLYVRDVTGVLLATLIDGEVPAGISTASFDASALRSGVYFYTLETAGGSISRRMALVK